MSDNWVLTALLGFWVPAMAAVTLFWFFRRSERRVEVRMDGMRSDDFRHAQAELQFRLDRILGELRDQIQRLEEFSDASRRELQGNVRGVMESVLAGPLSKLIASEISKGLADRALPTPSTDTLTQEAIVADLAHGIKTPLAHIEASLLELRATGSSDGQLLEMISSVDLIKAVLAAFRQVTRTSGNPDKWSPSDLQVALTAAHSVFNTTTGKRTELRLRSVPQALDGYSNNLLVGVLLPLLQNAVEASPEGELVEMVFIRSADGFSFRLSNRTSSPADPQALQQRGKSTKAGHEGIGLASVSDLLKGIPNAKLRFNVMQDDLEVVVSLPDRART